VLEITTPEINKSVYLGQQCVYIRTQIFRISMQSAAICANLRTIVKRIFEWALRSL